MKVFIMLIAMLAAAFPALAQGVVDEEGVLQLKQDRVKRYKKKGAVIKKDEERQYYEQHRKEDRGAYRDVMRKKDTEKLQRDIDRMESRTNDYSTPKNKAYIESQKKYDQQRSKELERLMKYYEDNKRTSKDREYWQEKYDQTKQEYDAVRRKIMQDDY